RAPTPAAPSGAVHPLGGVKVSKGVPPLAPAPHPPRFSSPPNPSRRNLHHRRIRATADFAHASDKVHCAVLVELDPCPRATSSSQAPLATGKTTANPLARPTGRRFCFVHRVSCTVQRRTQAHMAQAHPGA